MNAKELEHHLELSRKSINLAQAQAHLSELVSSVTADEPILLNVRNKPAVVLVKLEAYLDLLKKVAAYEAGQQPNGKAHPTFEQYNADITEVLADDGGTANLVSSALQRANKLPSSSLVHPALDALQLGQAPTSAEGIVVRLSDFIVIVQRTVKKLSAEEADILKDALSYVATSQGTMTKQVAASWSKASRAIPLLPASSHQVSNGLAELVAKRADWPAPSEEEVAGWMEERYAKYR